MLTASSGLFSPRRPATPLIPGRWLVAGVGVTLLASAALLWWAHLSLELSAGSLAMILGILLAACARYVMRAPRSNAARVARDVAESFALFALMCVVGALASYPVAAESAGFVDAELQHVDHLLHFDWLRWYAFVCGHPAVRALERTAYLSIFVTPALLLTAFALAGRQAESRLFIASYWLAALVTLSLFPLFPAVGPLVHLWHGPVPYMPLSAMYQSVQIPELRDHALRSVDLASMRGLVCMPSFHAVSAVLYIAAAWRVGRLRWPLIVLTAAMLLATPVEGTHYLTDILAGALVAVFSLLTTAIIARHCHSGAAQGSQPRDDTASGRFRTT